MSDVTALEHGQAIAIVGMSGRFPGAASVHQFWQNLCGGVESISFIPREELIKAGYPEAVVRDPAYVPAKGILEGIDLFDAAFFGCSPREAELMDPQHRLFLECGWSALEDAGYDPGRYDGAIGVFAGTGGNSYLLNRISTAPEVAMMMGWDKDYVATRLSYKLNLRGPSLTIQTACSTSLVAVTQACQSLLTFQCDLALAGGAAITVPERAGYRYVQSHIMSPDGHCRAFDASARGTVGGNGVALVVLKRLEEAVRDRDAICAVIRGFALNNDGAGKVGYTAPSVDGQAQVVAMAQALAGVSPDSITYVEAHGTGTELGDPIEIAALTQAFRSGTTRSGYCAIGSAKTNVGHLDAAAGVTGLIKASLALRHRQIPPSLHYETANPKIDFASSPFFVNTALRAWDSDAPRRAGVSSFGIGGTNAHVVLEEAPAAEPTSASRPWQVVPLSARSADALGRATDALAAHLRADPSLALPDVAYTLQTGRKAFPMRRVLVCREEDDAAAALLSSSTRTVESARAVGDAAVAFLFPGQGTQYAGMVRDLYAQEAAFRDAIDHCAARLLPILGWDVKRVLCAPAGDAEATQLLAGTRATQLALFVTEYALARLWTSWGVRPRALAGHSIGEYVAACIANVFSLDDALTLVAERGRLMEGSTGGAMLAVTSSVESVQPHLGDGLWLAAVNAADVCVISGTDAAVTALEGRLRDAGIGAQRLNTSGAFHSPMMADAAAALGAPLARVRLQKPEIPFLSNVTGTWISDADAVDPAYWQRQLVSTVRFDGAAALLREFGTGVLLEVGPGRTLGTLVRQQGAADSLSCVATLGAAHEKRTSTESVALALAHLWVRGAAIDWHAYSAAERRARVPLPTYPFERQRYWLDKSMFAKERTAAESTGKPQRTADVAKWFYAPAWTRRAVTAVAATADRANARTWLIFADDHHVAAAIAAAAAARGEQVTIVQAGDRFAQRGPGQFTIALDARADYQQLLQALSDSGRWPTHITHCWGVGADAADDRADVDPARDHARVLHSIRLLAQALAEAGQPGELKLTVVTTGVLDVTGAEPLSPGKASVLGLCRVLTQEHPQILCGHVDLDAEAGGAAAIAPEQIYADAAAGHDTVVAYRRGQRWVQAFTPVDLPPAHLPGRLRPRGVYVITGGLGRIAAVMAEYLARTVQARIVLTSRSAFPPESQWDALVVNGGPQAARVQRLRRIQRAGGELVVLQADAANREQMARVFATAQERFGAVHGVVHAAGWMSGDGFRGIVHTDDAVCARHFGPKVDALRVLDEVTRDLPLDFCMLTSSLSVLLGGVGYGAYAAVNAFMDAFAAKRNRTSAFPWIAVDWDGWATEELEAASAGHAPAGFLLTGAEGADAFGRILAGPPAPQIAVSVGDLDARIRRWVRIHEPAATADTAADPAAAAAAEVQRHPRPSLQNEYVAPRTATEQAIAAIWGEVLGFDRIGADDSFFELGGDSYLGIQVTARIKTALGGNLSAVTLYESPTVAALAAVVDGRPAATPTAAARTRSDSRDGDTTTEGSKVNRTASDTSRAAFAVVGMAGRFPGAPSIERFWQNLRDGVESRTLFSDEDAIAAGLPRSALSHPKLVRSGFILDDVEGFDAPFFGINPREAEILDPQHRIFLECAWEAMENAGYDAEVFPGLVGVFAGSTLSSYLLSNIARNGDLVRSVGLRQAIFGSVPDYMVTRVAYKLNLRGPAMFVQSACSTSLVAVHLACRSLATGESDMALAGGVSVAVPQRVGYTYEDGGMLSPDGICRTFDANARGTVFGNGVGLVVLKRLADAIADGDTIHAVIRGAAMNNDGSLKVGFTAPGVAGQAQVVSDALAAAGVPAESISYVEAHGTGTELGDPIEITALTRAYRRTTDKTQFCAVGSVKPNIGHLDAAAGVSSLIKTIMAMKHRQIPATINYEKPNPKIDFEDSPFFVNTTLRPWETNGTPRRAGVSSFGFGGTNAHVIVEEAPALEPSGPSRPQQVLVLAARTETALEAATDRLAASLETGQVSIADAAFTLATGRRHFGHRRALICADAADAADALHNRDARRTFTAVAASKDRSVVFMFPGQGSQYVRMGADLYRDEPVFRDAVDACARGLLAPLGADIREALYPEAADEAAATERLKQTAFTQASLFTIEYALAQLWLSWGIKPAAMIGHSVGELVAACVAGVFSLEDAVRLVAMRGRFMSEMAPGTMAAVPLPAERVTRLLGPGVSLAAVNAPSLCVISGPADAVDAFVDARSREGVECRRLHTSHAFHSAMMDDAVTRFAEEVASTERHAPSIPFISNVTGTWITAEEATDPGYWSMHIRRPVAFSEGIATLLGSGDRLLLEVGPGNTLSGLARQQASGSHQIVSSLRHPQERTSDTTTVLSALARLWVNGAAVDWKGYFAGEQRRRVPLPAYPFERQKYWVEPEKFSLKTSLLRMGAMQQDDFADWFHAITWRRSPAPAAAPADPASACVVFESESVPGAGLTAALGQAFGSVLRVRAGERFEKIADDLWTVRPDVRDDYNALIASIGATGVRAAVLVHAWGLTGQPDASPDDASVARMQRLGFFSLVALTQALGSAAAGVPLRLAVVTDGAHEVVGGEPLVAERATVVGPCKVIPQEFPNISCVHIDLPVGGAMAFDGVVNEIRSSARESFVAYRNGRRWTQTCEAHRLEDVPAGMPTRLREQGTYLITGGFGGIGVVLAEYLAEHYKARLVLTARRALPPRDTWDAVLAGSDENTRKRIEAVKKLEALGAEVLTGAADVTDEPAMRAVVAEAIARFGRIDGVIHSAGVAGGGVIQLKKPEVAAAVLAPKVLGTRILARIFTDQPLDFMLLCSSMASLVGGVGQVDYTAANACLDAFARQYAAQTGTFTVAVNWNAWREVGMAVDTNVPEDLRDALKGAMMSTGISNREGIDAFRRILARSTEAQVAISPNDLSVLATAVLLPDDRQMSANLAPAPEKRAGSAAQPAAAAKVKGHPRPPLPNPFVAPRTDAEKKVCVVWQELLGIDGIGIDDNFFELGGHSLLAIRVMSRVNDVLATDMPVARLYDGLTVRSLAEAAQPAEAAAVAVAADDEDGDDRRRDRMRRQREQLARRRGGVKEVSRT